MNYFELCIDFINKVNPNYTINSDGFLYFEDRHVAISFNERWQSATIPVGSKFVEGTYLPEGISQETSKYKGYFTDLHVKYDKLGIRLMQIFDWQITDPETFNKIKMLLVTAIGTPKKIMSRKCEVRQISDAEAKPINDRFHMMGHRRATVTYGLYYEDKLAEIMSFAVSKWNRNIKDDNSWEVIRGCQGSINAVTFDEDPENLYFVAGGPSRLMTHFIRDYNPNMLFSYCDAALFNGKSYLASGMKYAGSTGDTKWWLLPDIDPNTGKPGLIIPRNPSKYKELKERSGNVIVWTPGSDRYIWCKPGYKYEGKGKEFLEEN